MSEMMPEKPSPRVPLQLNVVYRKNYARNSDLGLLKNISLSGAFLEHNAHGLMERDKLMITLEVGGRTRNLNAHVVWCNQNGVGIKFHHFHNRDIQMVDDLIYFVENSRSTRRNVLDTIFRKVS